MFTGIIETTGIIHKIEKSQANISFYIKSNLIPKLKIGDSVSHNGVCLTIEEFISSEIYKVTAIQETLSKTNLGLLKENDIVNLECSLLANGKIDGHFVQGHVDCIGFVYKKNSKNGSYEYQILYPTKFKQFIIPRGSIALDGISLTISNINDSILNKDELKNIINETLLHYSDYSSFYVNIIPHTYQITNIKKWEKGSIINIEFDVLGKYIYRFFEVTKQSF
ncbi:MAG: riboflavin synthase subunit alpha [Leptospiraceae bacterium]|nr:MAG: riboflavin synthase subunit alpha [Leptospiraceae bacterium]